jgi:hypothetical protein
VTTMFPDQPASELLGRRSSALVLLGALFDTTCERPHAVRKFASKWAVWAATHCLAIAKAWSGCSAAPTTAEPGPDAAQPAATQGSEPPVHHLGGTDSQLSMPGTVISLGESLGESQLSGEGLHTPLSPPSP